MTYQAARDDSWLSPLRDRPLFAYAFACLTVAAATGVSFLWQPFEWQPAVVYVGAVAATAFFAGLGPALLATVLSAAVIEFVLLPPPMKELLVLGTFGGVAVAIGWLADRVESGRQKMERAARRSALLSEATRLVGEASSYEEALGELPELLCREVADYAVTYAVDPEGDGEIRRVGIAHADPERRPLVRRLMEHRTPTVRDGYGAGAVIRSGEPILVEEAPDEILAAAAEGDEEYLELLRRLDPVSVVVVPLRARGHTIGALAVVATGRTGRRYDEEDLELMVDLGYRAALALDNRRLLEEARAATRAREQIMAVVAHDLRTPLSSIGFAADRLAGPDGAEHAPEMAKAIDRACDQCFELIEDLVDLSRMEAGEYDVDPRPVPLRQLLREVSESVELDIERRGVRLAVSDAAEAAVRVDPESIQRVFANLVDNACRFSPEGGTVRVDARPRDEEVVFSVTDDGPGFPEESIPHVFEQFWQGEEGGEAGLGLAIVKGIVEAHGGRVWAEDVGEGGATVCFNLPRAPEPERARSARS